MLTYSATVGHPGKHVLLLRNAFLNSLFPGVPAGIGYSNWTDPSTFSKSIRRTNRIVFSKLLESGPKDFFQCWLLWAIDSLLLGDMKVCTERAFCAIYLFSIKILRVEWHW